MIKNIFDPLISEEVIKRIEQLAPTSKALWGKMSVDQMLAHCNVTYELTFNPEQFPQPGLFKKFLLKTFVKKMVTSAQAYPKNGRTAKEFLIVDRKNFEHEKNRLIDYILKTQKLGTTHFEGKENISFGKMTATEWNALFYKHLDHHLSQFGQ